MKTPMEKYEDLFMKTRKTSPYVINIPMDIVLNIIEKQKYDQTIYTFYQNNYIRKLFRRKRVKEGRFNKLFQILDVFDAPPWIQMGVWFIEQK